MRPERQILAWSLLGALLAGAPSLLVEGPRAQESRPAESSLDAGDPGVEVEPWVGALEVGPGGPFPTLELPALHPGQSKPSPVKLGTDLRKRPVVLFYFSLGHHISEDIYLEVQRFVESELEGKAVLYPVVQLGVRHEVTELRERMELLGIGRPVLLDEQRRIRHALGMHHAPHMALIHADGDLVFSGARCLNHPVYGETTAGDAIRMSVAGQRPFAKEIWSYYPASDFIGKKFMDVHLPRYDTGETIRIGDLVEPGKLTALFYWSPKDRFSRAMLGSLSVAQRAFVPRHLNLVAVAREGTRDEIRALAEKHGLAFPIVRNPDQRFTGTYRVISTPTLILIRPDGIIDSVYTSGRINLFPIINTKIKSLVISLPAPSSAAPSSG